MRKAKAKKPAKRKGVILESPFTERSWDEQMAIIIRANAAGDLQKTVEKVGQFSDFELGNGEDALEDGYDALYNRYNEEIDYLYNVVSDLIERLESAGASLKLPAKKAVKRGRP